MIKTCCNCTRSPRTGGRAGSISSASRHAALVGIRLHQGDDFARQEVEIEAALFGLALFHHGPHPIDHLACAMVVLADVRQDGPQFVKVRRRILQKQLRCLGVAQDGAKRLVQFVRERGGKLPHGGDAGNVSQLVALLLEFHVSFVCASVISSDTPDIRSGAPVGVKNALARTSNPSDASIRQHNTVVMTEISSFLEALL